jgi:esterase/lipase superfamily enzyme
MLFLTNRAFRQGKKTRIGRPVSFDLNNNDVGVSLFFCERNAKDDYTEIGSQAFMQKLKDSNKKQILLYIHGFNNMPESDIFPRAEMLAALSTAQGLSLEVAPVIWPCDNSLGIVKDYFDDQRAADASGAAFARALSKFLGWQEKNAGAADTPPCLKRINILAHSMGNRVLRETLHDWAKSMCWEVPFIFRNIFMASADVLNETLHREEDGRFICQCARNVVVYFASDDLALRSSKVANVANGYVSRRLGHTGPEQLELTPDNVYAIDCDEVNTSYDSPKGHSYFLSGKKEGEAGAVFRHMARCMDTGRVPVEPGSRRLILKDGWK